MIHIKKFTFNPFQENTYILYNDAKQAIIIDPGMYEPYEYDLFFDFIDSEKLNPILLLNTHTHLDHVFGNNAVIEKYKISFAFHELDRPVFDKANEIGRMYGVEFDKLREPNFYIKETEKIQLGNDTLNVLLAPGHSPGSVCFYHESQKIIISGDVLFHNSIGRTDLPGGDYETLINSIKTQLLPLPNDVIVYSGHGPETTIGREKANNPFLNS